jgi:hypothetical protein
MKRMSLSNRVKMIHWTWWALWLASLVMVGLMVLNYPRFIDQEMVESFRYPWGLMPVELLPLRYMGRYAGEVTTVSLMFVVFALYLSNKGAASFFMALAVGVIMVFFWMNSLLYMLTAASHVKAQHDELQSRRRAVPEQQQVPKAK